jgi:PTS system galactitol-specific IIC component
METVSQYITDLGAAVALPFIIFILALVLGAGIGSAVRSGIKIGVGFVGIGLVIGLLLGQLGPAAQAMVENFGVDLNVIDVGWPSTAAIAFGSRVGALVIPVGLAVNVILLTVGLTKTLNIDLWNYWHIAFTGAIVAIITDSFAAGLLTAGIHMILLLALADWSAPWIQRYYNFPGISLPHGTSAPYVFFAIPLNRMFDRIPGLRDWKADPDAIQRRFGVLGESVVLGAVLGLLIGLLGYGFDDPRGDSIAILQLSINLAAVMLLLPRVVAILMEGLIPIAEGAQRFVKRRFPGRQFYIGLDSAIAVGAPAVIATSLLLVPITLLLAVALPGNRVLPFGDLATIPFIVAMMVPLFGGNIIRSVIGGSLVIGGGLYIATAISNVFTTAAGQVDFEAPEGATQLSSLVDGANPVTGVFAAVANLEWIGLVGLLMLALAFAWWVKTKAAEPEAAQVGSASEYEAAAAAEVTHTETASSGGPPSGPTG